LLHGTIAYSSWPRQVTEMTSVTDKYSEFILIILYIDIIDDFRYSILIIAAKFRRYQQTAKMPRNCSGLLRQSKILSLYAGLTTTWQIRTSCTTSLDSLHCIIKSLHAPIGAAHV
jgi:hypothetical protein